LDPFSRPKPKTAATRIENAAALVVAQAVSIYLLQLEMGELIENYQFPSIPL